MKKILISVALIGTLLISNTSFAMLGGLEGKSIRNSTKNVASTANKIIIKPGIGLDIQVGQEKYSATGRINYDDVTEMMGSLSEMQELADVLDKIVVKREPLSAPAKVMYLEDDNSLAFYVNSKLFIFKNQPYFSYAIAKDEESEALFEVPLRTLFEGLGFNVEWNDKDKTITVAQK